MSLKVKFFNNTREPKGLLGQIMIIRMNHHHKFLVSWALSNFPKDEKKDILEIGCGGGKNALELLKTYKNAHLTAVDYSPVSIKNSKKVLRHAIKDGKCEVLEQNVLNLTLEKERYDLITAFETVYFWKDLNVAFKNVLDCLKPGGQFIITHENDGCIDNVEELESMIDGLRLYKFEEMRDALLSVGFSDVTMIHHDINPWIMVFATK